MHTNRFAFLDAALFGIVLFGIVVLPLFFLPFTLNILDLNKQFLLYFLLALGVLVWFVTLLLKKVLVFHQTVIDIPVVLLWLLMLLSTIFSLDRQASFLGGGSAFTYSFLFHTALTVFYFFITQTVERESRLKALVYAVGLAGVLSAAFFYIFGLQSGLTIGPSTIRFNTVSALNSLFVVSLVPAFFVALSYLLDKTVPLKEALIWGVVLVVVGPLLFISGFNSVNVMLMAGLIMMVVTALLKAKQVRYTWAAVLFGLFLVSVLLIFVKVPESLHPGFPGEVSLGRSASNAITAQTLATGAKTFLLGAGPGTFQALFSLYRTSSFNALDDNFWTIRFENPFSAVHTVVAELGVLGALVFVLLFIAGVTFSLFRKDREEPLGASVFLPSTIPVIFVTLSVGLFFNTYDTVTWVWWWLFFALTVIMFQPRGTVFASSHNIPLSDAPQYSLTLSFVTVLIVVSVGAFGVYLGKWYGAEVALSKAVRGDRPFEERIALLDSAVRKRPTAYAYRLVAARFALGEAERLAGITGSPPERIGELFRFAVNEARIATNLAPQRVSTWQFLALMYLYAQPFEPRSSALAVEALERAIALEPTNPFFFNQIGNAYAFQNNREKAVQSFERAILLKPNLTASYVNLADLYVNLKDLSSAAVTLERGIQFAGSDASYVLRLAGVYLERQTGDDLERVKTILDAVKAREPDNVAALYVEGRLMEKRGNVGRAIALYKEVLARDAYHVLARERLSLLQAPPSSEGESESQ